MATKKSAKRKRAPAKKRSAPKPKAAKRPPRPPRRQPETLRLRACFPEVIVADFQRSIRWYRDILGMSEGQKYEYNGQLIGIEMKAGTITFYLTQDSFDKGREGHKGMGVRLWARTAQDIDQLATRVKTKGGVLVKDVHDVGWGPRGFLIDDPDGYHLTIFQEA
jgi:catechol 2,3-dioxygenase-like lactoylglutathione lyase family enzyme